jgi:cytochrome c-type biogenesis protein CcmH/NrfG
MNVMTLNKKYLVGAAVVVLIVVAAGIAVYQQKKHQAGIIAYQDPHLSASDAAPFEKSLQGIQAQLKQAGLSKEDQFKLYMSLGDQYRVLGHFKEARDNYALAHQLIPDNIYAVKELYAISEQMKDYKAARDYLQLALKIDPNNRTIYQKQLDMLPQ